MSITKHFTNEELSRARDEMLRNPRWHQFVNITEAIKIELEGSFPSNKLLLYSYTAQSATYWFAQRNFNNLSKRTYAAFDGKIVDEDLEEAFLVFNVEERLTDHQLRLLVAFDSNFGEKLIALITKHGGTTPAKVTNALRFYMTPQQKHMTNHYELVVPAGFELGSATVEDVNFLTTLSQFAKKGDDVQTRRKIAGFPSSVVRHNGEIVAVFIVDPTGMLSELHNQWVKPEHRPHGLGHLVEMDLCKKMISKGYNIFKHIHTTEVPLVNASMSSKFYTVATMEDGSIQYLKYSTF